MDKGDGMDVWINGWRRVWYGHMDEGNGMGMWIRESFLFYNRLCDDITVSVSACKIVSTGCHGKDSPHVC